MLNFRKKFDNDLKKLFNKNLTVFRLESKISKKKVSSFFTDECIKFNKKYKEQSIKFNKKYEEQSINFIRLCDSLFSI